ncbi:MAG: hypothetical protein V1729_01260 [Candidatus Woesearchaeota archaeon]
MSNDKNYHEKIILNCDVAELDRIICRYGMSVEFGHAQLGSNPDFQPVSFMEYILQDTGIAYRKLEKEE